MSPKKKIKYAPLSSGATERLEPYRDLMGKRPDGEIAKLAGMDRRYVVVFRIHNDIPAYRRGSASKSAPSADDAKPRRLRKSKLDEFRHLMGDVPDGRIAELAGCSREAVMRYRKRYGIDPAPRGRKTDEALVAVAAPAPAPVVEPAPAAVVEPAPAPVQPALDLDIDDLPPEPDELLELQASQPEDEPQPEEAPGLEGYVVRVLLDGEEEAWMILGADLADAAQRAVRIVAERSPSAQVVELSYCADLL